MSGGQFDSSSSVSPRLSKVRFRWGKLFSREQVRLAILHGPTDFHDSFEFTSVLALVRISRAGDLDMWRIAICAPKLTAARIARMDVDSLNRCERQEKRTVWCQDFFVVPVCGAGNLIKGACDAVSLAL